MRELDLHVRVHVPDQPIVESAAGVVDAGVEELEVPGEGIGPMRIEASRAQVARGVLTLAKQPAR